MSAYSGILLSAAGTVALMLSFPAPARGEDAPEPSPLMAPAPASQRELDALRSEMKAEVSGLKAENEELRQRLSSVEGDAESRQASDAFRLRVYGFASAFFGRNFVDSGSYWDGYLPDRWTFGLSDFNLYTDARAGERWRFLGEVRFLQAPNGTQSFGGTSFVHQDTTVLDPYYGTHVRWNALYVERAQIEYKLSDLFGVIAGRFLTPYGVWNVEHGAPVLIPIRMPFPMANEEIPRAQTGLQLFGRVFPAASLQVEYALTLSNGRGPMDEVYDLDNNKAVGFRLRAVWERPGTRLAAGTYLYAGQYSDRQKTISMAGGLSLPSSATVQYDEKSAAFDLMLEHGPVRLQGEFIRRAVQYADGKRAPDLQHSGYTPDHVAQGAYGLLAVRLPVPRLDLRAYGMFEWDSSVDFTTTVKIYTGGLNYRLTPAVVTKAEVFWVHFDTTTPQYTGWWGVSSQVAISF